MKHISLISFIVAVMALTLVVYAVNKNEPASESGGYLAGVTVGNEYNSTTLVPSSSVGGVIAGRQSTLGGVTITGSAGGGLTLYNATTTNVNLRTGQTATSSLEILAAFEDNQAVGTYVFDSVVTTGIIYEVVGAIPTTTISYR